MIAIKEVREKINLEYVLSDAMPLELDIPSLPIIKGDAKSISIGKYGLIDGYRKTYGPIKKILEEKK